MNKIYLIFIVLCIGVIFSGCYTDRYYSSGNTITTPVQIGMTIEEVKAIMGESGQRAHIWNHRLKEQLWTLTYCLKQPSFFQQQWNLTIYFKDNKVVDIREWAPGL
jgi:hypothetical protein